MSVHYSAKTDKGVYTITCEIAGGGFTLNLNGFCLAYMYGDRLSRCRSAARRHNGAELNWVDEIAIRYGYTQAQTRYSV
jgi:hypothetical protein